MGFQYRRNTTGDGVQALKLFKLDATYAQTAKKYDVVKLNGSGDVVKAAAGDTSVLGVLENIELKKQGETDTYGHVRTNATAIYEVPVATGTPVVGVAYPIDANHKIDASTSTNAVVKVVEVRGSNVLVQITGRQLV